jgi:hypothetical protein
MMMTAEIMLFFSSKIWEDISKVFLFSKELVEFFQIKISAEGHYILGLRLMRINTARWQCFGRALGPYCT